MEGSRFVITLSGIALAATMLAAGRSAAQTADQAYDDRLANQERRIAEGLRDGSLTAGEAARLQREETSLNREAARVQADGVITPQERARMERDLNRVSRDISNERHDAQRANPNNPFNQRLGDQADRIANGIRDGSLTQREAARLEREESRIAREEARFLRDGHLSPWERRKLDRDLDRASRDIWRERHDAQGTLAPTPHLDRREANQADRIRDGVRDGSLTRGEAARLGAEQRHIRREEARFKADGNVTPRERAHLERDLNRASRDISRARHNRRHR